MPQKAPDHIVKSFDDELRKLREQILAMGGRAEAQLADAISCAGQARFRQGRPRHRKRQGHRCH